MAQASTTNGDSSPTLDFKPPSGVVLPPREIRNIAEKTAGYVDRNGVVFEERIREKERQNPKFGFLHPGDPFNAYYLWRLSEIKEGRGTTIAAGRAGEAPAPVEEKPKGPPKPPDFHFSPRMPRINQKDLEVVRLTALYVAKHGRQWMTGLAQREAGNPQFQFLIPNHTFHNFFQHLVDQYSILLKEGGLGGEGGKLQNERVAGLKRNQEDKYHKLTSARQRAEWIKFQEEEKQKKDLEEEEKKLEFARVDWNDFVVVETIVFNESDEQANLPPPTTLADLQYASLEEKKQVSVSANLRIEEAMPTDEETTYNAYPAPAAQTQSQPQPQTTYPLPVHPAAPSPSQPQTNPYSSRVPLPPAPAQQPYPSSGLATVPIPTEEDRIKERVDARARMQQAQTEAKGGAGPMKIKENYVPKASGRAANKTGVQYALCPNCKQQIPMDELDQHMKIELLDPSWKEQKAKTDQRFAMTNLSTTEVANNLKRLASQRTDVFDPILGHPVSEEEAARRKRATIQPVESHADPKAASQPPHLVNVEEQIRAIHQKFAERK
ncbi:pre-mRNA splicing factor [Zalerion maritima]|uniref:Pre-mRNA splicing factor n=1 Tax=Zalerion maritima TaxID=339359 RepID=A0AAD5S4T6_9PEZI|nr:pre-mRNA splicing factor [Zalerion maritima]